MQVTCVYKMWLHGPGKIAHKLCQAYVNHSFSYHYGMAMHFSNISGLLQSANTSFHDWGMIC